MSGKHRHWHREWARQEDGTLQHTTGLVFAPGPRGLPVLDRATLPAFAQAEIGRGVPPHALQRRLRRLTLEADVYHRDPRNY